MLKPIIRNNSKIEDKKSSNEKEENLINKNATKKTNETSELFPKLSNTIIPNSHKPDPISPFTIKAFNPVNSSVFSRTILNSTKDPLEKRNYSKKHRRLGGINFQLSKPIYRLHLCKCGKNKRKTSLEEQVRAMFLHIGMNITTPINEKTYNSEHNGTTNNDTDIN